MARPRMFARSKTLLTNRQVSIELGTKDSLWQGWRKFLRARAQTVYKV
jgi:hypothetical protein